MIGKTVRIIQTGTKVAEQIINKLYAKISTSVLLETTSFNDDQASRLASLDLKSREEEWKTYTQRGKMYKITKGRLSCCLETEATTKQRTYNFVRLKDGRFVIIIYFSSIDKIHGFEIIYKPLVGKKVQ